MGRDRKGLTASSSAKAAERVGSAAATFSAGMGFGGFSGAQPLAPSPSSDVVGLHASGGQEALAIQDLDPELAQHIRRLAKRDINTRLKALQSLRQALPARGEDAVAGALLPWACSYRRLVMDNVRNVRGEAAAVMGDLAATLGRRLAPCLRRLIGPWFFSTHDPHREARELARTALATAFPGPKGDDAVTRLAEPIVAFLAEIVESSPADLGDDKKETPEELAERHERAVTQALVAFADLVDRAGALRARVSADAPDKHSQALAARLEGALGSPSVFRTALGSPSDSVRAAGYHLVLRMAAQLGMPETLAGLLPQTAGLILGSIGDQSSASRGAMAEMVLAVCHQYPEIWTHAGSVHKTLLPKLVAAARGGFAGGALQLAPAVLPLLAVMPQAIRTGSVCRQILEALLHGTVNESSSAAREAMSQALVECVKFLARADDEEGAAAALAFLAKPCMDAALGSSGAGSLPGQWDIATDILARAAAAVLEAAERGRGGAGRVADAFIDAARARAPSAEALQRDGDVPVARVWKRLLSTLLAAVEGGTRERVLRELADPAVAAAVASLERLASEGAGPADTLTMAAGLVRAGAAAPAAATFAASLLVRLVEAPDMRSPSSAAAAELLVALFLGPVPHAWPDLLRQLREHPLEQRAMRVLLQLLRAGLSAAGEALRHDQTDALALSLPFSPRKFTDRTQEEVICALLAAGALSHAAVAQLADRLAEALRADSGVGAVTIATAAAVRTWGVAAAVAEPLVSSLLATAASGDAAAATSSATAAGLLSAALAGSLVVTPSDVAAFESASQAVMLTGTLPQERAMTVGSLAAAAARQAWVGSGQGDLLVRVMGAAQERLPVEARVSLVRGIHRDALASLAGLFASSLRASPGGALTDPGTARRLAEAVQSVATLGNGHVPDDVSRSLVDETLSAILCRDCLGPWPVFARPHADGAGVAPATDAGARKVAMRSPEYWSAAVAVKGIVDALGPDVVFGVEFVETQGAVHPDQARRGGAGSGESPSATREWVYMELLSGMAVRQGMGGVSAEARAAAEEVLSVCASAVVDVRRGGTERSDEESGDEGDAGGGRDLQSYHEVSRHFRSTAGTVLAVLRALLRLGDGRDGAAAWAPQLRGRAAGWVLSLLAGVCGEDTQVGRCAGHEEGPTGSPEAMLVCVFRECCERYDGAMGDWGRRPGVEEAGEVLAALDDLIVVVGASAGALHALQDPFFASKATQWVAECARQVASEAPTLAQSPLHALPPPSPPPAAPSALESSQFAASLGLLRLANLCVDLSLNTPLDAPPSLPVPHPGAAGGGAARERVAQLAADLVRSQMSILEFKRPALEAAWGWDGDEAGVAEADGAGAGRATGDSHASSLFSECEQGPLSWGWLARGVTRELAVCARAAMRVASASLDAHDWDVVLEFLGTALTRSVASFEEVAEGVSDTGWCAAGAHGLGSYQDAGVPLANALLTEALRARAGGTAGIASELPSEAAEAVAEELAGCSLAAVAGSSGLDVIATAVTLACRLAQGTEGAAPVLAPFVASAALDLSRLLIAASSVSAMVGALRTVADLATPHAGSGQAASVAALHARWQRELAGTEDLWRALEGALAALGSTGHLGGDVLERAHQEAKVWSPDAGAEPSLALAMAAAQGPPAVSRAAARLLATRAFLRPAALRAGWTPGEGLEGLGGVADVDAVTATEAGVLAGSALQPWMALAFLRGEEGAGRMLGEGTPTDASLAAWAVLCLAMHEVKSADSDSGAWGPPLASASDVVSTMGAQARGFVDFVAKELCECLDGTGPQARFVDEAGVDDAAGMGTALGALLAGAPGAAWAPGLFRAALWALPALAREWFLALKDRRLAQAIERHTAAVEAPLLLRHELSRCKVEAGASSASADPDAKALTVRASTAIREVVANVEIEDGQGIDLRIKLPECWPLKSAEVDFPTGTKGVSQAKSRRWLLGITVLLRSQNGAVVDAVRQWHASASKELSGEPCLICCSVLHPTDHSLPRMLCKTCNQAFHGSCLFKWFRSGGKSNCPHCQSPW